jgi:hypothetical protein
MAVLRATRTGFAGKDADMVPIWATGFAAFAVPILLIFFTFAIAPPPEDRKYRHLVLLGILAFGAVLLNDMALQRVHSSLGAVKTGLLYASLDNAVIAGGLALWLAGIRRPSPGDAIFAAVVIAATISAFGNFWIIKSWSGDFASWAAVVGRRSLFTITGHPVDGFLIGLWTALSIARWGDCRRLEALAGFAIAIFVDGLWGVLAASVDGWPESMLMLVMLGIKAAAVVPGVRYLHQAGFRLRWPPSLA